MTGERALIIARQSRTIGETVSLDDQVAHCQRWCDEHGYRVVGTVQMPNTRGWKEQRADHDEARRLAADKAVDVVVGYDISRVARSVRILETFVHDLDKHKVRLELASQPWANTPIMRQIFGAVSELETSQKRERQQDLWFYLQVHRGRWHGREPYGYVRAGSTIIPKDDEAAVVAIIFDLALTGMGCAKIAQELNRRGIPSQSGGPWWHQTVLRMVRNPVYAGGAGGKHGVRFPPDGEVWHPPLIERATWERVQAIQQHMPPMRAKSEPSWLEGLVQHQCGLRMYYMTPVGKGKTGGPRVPVPLFRCRSFNSPHACGVAQRAVSAKNLQAAAITALVRDLESAVTPERAYEALRAAERSDGTRTRRDALTRQRDALLAQRDRAEALHLSGRRDRAWFDAEDDRIAVALREIERDVAALPVAIDPGDLARRAGVLSSLGALVTDLAEADADALAAMLREVGVRLVVSGEGCRWRWPSPLDALIPESAPVRIRFARRVG